MGLSRLKLCGVLFCHVLVDTATLLPRVFLSPRQLLQVFNQRRHRDLCFRAKHSLEGVTKRLGDQGICGLLFYS